MYIESLENKAKGMEKQLMKAEMRIRQLEE